MKVLTCLLTLTILSCSIVYTHADAHGGVHVRIPTCENDEEEPELLPNVCIEMKPWYHHQQYDEYDKEDVEDQSYRLQDDTSWPGHREDFSDYLFRDKVFEQPL